MPRFYFYVSHEEPHFDDRDGIDLPDRAAAWEQATRACAEMLAEIDGSLPLGSDWHMQVYENRTPMFEIHFGARDCSQPAIR